MHDYIGSTDITVHVPLMVDGAPKIPDVGTVNYTVYDHAGTPMAGLTNVAVTTDATTHTVSINVAAANNAIDSGKKFERRTVVLTMLSAGRPLRFTLGYRLIPFLNHSVTVESVREFCGVGIGDLPDDSVDLTSIFFQIEAAFGNTSLSEVLASGTVAEIAANDCIRMRAVLSVIPSLKQRIAQMESNGVHQFRRNEAVNFRDLEQAANDRYSKALLAATGQEAADLSFVLTTQDTDPITG